MAVCTPGDDEPGKVFRRLVNAIHSNGELTIDGINPPGRQFQVLSAQRRFNIGYRQTTRGEFYPVEPHTHGITAGTPHTDVGNTIDHSKLINDEAFSIIIELQKAHLRAGQIEKGNRSTVCVGLGNLWRLYILRQSPGNAGNLVANIIGSLIDVASDFKLH